MRPWPALLVLALVALPAAALPVDCPNVRDPSLLPSVEESLQAAQAAGYELRPLGPLPLDAAAQARIQTGPLNPCTGKIRPGAQLIIDGRAACTLNWVFLDETGAYYAGTAGHCLDDFSTPGCDPVLYTNLVVAGVGDIGDGVYSTGNCNVGNDFALIRIDPALYGKVEPTMCHWGGPQTVAHQGDPGTVSGHMVILHYGWGVAYGENPLTRGRAGLLHTGGWSQNSVMFEAAANPGDSGSGLETNYGAAVGILTHGIGVPGAPVGLGVVYGTRLDKAIGWASAATGHDIQLYASERPVDLTGLGTP